MGFYRADLRSSCLGQQFLNTFWYRDRDPFSGDLIDQSELLGEALNTHFFPALGAIMPAIVHEECTWEEWAIMPLEAIGFGPALSAPVVVTIGRTGGATGSVLPPATVGIISFNLRPGLITSGLYQPRRAYVAIGPIAEAQVDDAGLISDPSYAAWQDTADVMAANVGTVLGAGGWAPVRYGTNGTLQGFAEVDGATARRVVSFRRSRMPEA